MPTARLPRERQPALGEALKRNRLRLGWSQEELALQAGIDRTWISRIERGGNPEWATVKKLAGAMDITMLELIALVERIELE